MGSAARKYDDALYSIGITGATTPQPSAQNTTMNFSDSIEFVNNTTYAVSITFTTTSGIVFANIASLGPGQNSGQVSPNMNNVTVDFTITSLTGGGASSAAGIQVGTGPLRINILADNTNPDPVSIPNGGQIQFHPDASYQISFTPPNAFTPAVSTVSPTSSPVLTATNLARLATYTLVGRDDTKGKGTVKIGS